MEIVLVLAESSFDIVVVVLSSVAVPYKPSHGYIKGTGFTFEDSPQIAFIIS